MSSPSAAAGLVLPGAGGIGKSALAAEVAVRAGRLQPRFLTTLPGAHGPALEFRHLGPLSHSASAEPAMSLPALRLLSEQELDRAWRLLAGHPRAIEYLDALLATGHVSFQEVARRLAGTSQASTRQPIMRKGPDAPTGLSPGAAETIALAAGDLLLGDLFGRLSADAHRSRAGHDTGPRAGCRPGGFAAIDRYPSDMGASVIAAGPPCDPRTLPFGERRSQSPPADRQAG